MAAQKATKGHCLMYFLFFLFVASSTIMFLGNYVNQPNHSSNERGVLNYHAKSPQSNTNNATLWDRIEIPKISHYGFEPPKNRSRWTLAQRAAASGSQIFLQQIMKHFPHAYNFLDGDLRFRSIQLISDIFVDEQNQRLRDLTPRPSTFQPNTTNVTSGQNADPDAYTPGTYDFRRANRAPVVSLGYFLFESTQDGYFSGKYFGHAHLMKKYLLLQWSEIKSEIDTPFIGLYLVDQNFGLFSTFFPNRTTPKGTSSCCNMPWDLAILPKFLEDARTLMMVVNQHSNYSHPKILTWPIGLKIREGQHAEKIIWDAMRYSVSRVKKSVLLYSASSRWYTRPAIVECVAERFASEPSEFERHFRPNAMPMSAEERYLQAAMYYRKLASARFGLALPGQGYDCYRTWELLTMGSIPVLERGVGLDRTLWKLPALLVDDFAYVTPTLLRSAYVEAIYRAIGEEFEFQRLTQSYWLETVALVSTHKSSEPLLERFPMTAEQQDFTRPRVPYSCAYTNSCGPGTKRIPLISC